MATFYHLHYRRVPCAKPGDTQYSLMGGDEILATVRLSRPINDATESWIFLRSLCVSTLHRRKSLALKLLQRVLKQQKFPVYCFAEPALSDLYAKAGFARINATSNEPQPPASLTRKFATIQSRALKHGHELYCFRWSYAGWKDKFGGSLSLCTADIADELLHQTGFESAGRVIRDRLEAFSNSNTRPP
jgi:predicted N-acetyltransferase YhbS